MLSKSTQEKLNNEINQTCEDLKISGIALTIYQHGNSLYENWLITKIYG
ncbi:hypothetical protein J18TS1_26630 [Oceanobacillus oncorhynchi subsp. incaldanensis]|nr:hypothetical protein [Oceanobacillus oncorhynchi]GIO19563.1 hypothetical protein J18TS1_26630 [Oceanobacillus oncorhynchi subsp. incaldanensis]